LCLLAGLGVTMFPWRRARPALALALAGTALLALPIYYSNVVQDYRTAIHWTEQRYQPGDGLVCTAWSCSLAVEYYARVDGRPTPLVEGAPGSWSWQAMGPIPFSQAALATYAAAHRRIFFLDSVPPDDAADVKAQARQAQDWLNRNYRLAAQIALRGPVNVQLYIANPGSSNVP
jgi:hypothetical protein